MRVKCMRFFGVFFAPRYVVMRRTGAKMCSNSCVRRLLAEISREILAKFCLEGCESAKENFPLERTKFWPGPTRRQDMHRVANAAQGRDGSFLCRSRDDLLHER